MHECLCFSKKYSKQRRERLLFQDVTPGETGQDSQPKAPESTSGKGKEISSQFGQ
jgi:hypothetical protein